MITSQTSTLQATAEIAIPSLDSLDAVQPVDDHVLKLLEDAGRYGIKITNLEHATRGQRLKLALRLANGLRPCLRTLS